MTDAKLTGLQWSVVETILYSDVFDYPLTAAEIHRDLVGTRATLEQVEAAVEHLRGRYLDRADGYVFARGRGHTVAARRQRVPGCAAQWEAARAYAGMLSAFPFVRMVAVCGSLAVDNSGDDGDVDIFCIAAPRRVWWVQAAAMLLRRLPRFARHRVCPNFFLSLPDLSLDHHDLYTAHEIVQAVPLTGHQIHRRFIDANRWLQEFLPNSAQRSQATRRREAPGDRQRPLKRRGTVTRWLERLGGGRFGNLLDAWLYVVLLAYYRVRLARRGVTMRTLRRYYRRDRQLVIGHGYDKIVRERFAGRVAALLGREAADRALQRCFPTRPQDGPTRARGVTPPAIYARQFARRYGAQR